MVNSIQLAPGTIDALNKGKNLRFDDSSGQLLPCKFQSSGMREKVMNVLIAQLQLMDYKPSIFSPQRKVEILTAADLFHKSLIKRHKKQLDKGLVVNKSNESMLKIAQLERHVMAAKLRGSINIGSLKDRHIEQSYQCAINKDLLSKWLNMQTYKGVSKGMDDRVVEQQSATDAFILHPADVDFVMKGNIDKQMGRHNDHLQIDPVTKHIMFKCDGVYQTADKIQEFLKIDGCKVVRKDNGARYFYRYDRGLTQFDPEVWDKLPIFEHKDHRKTQDFRVEVMSVVGKENHTWIRLKDPQGNIRIPGFFWKDGEEIKYLKLCESMQGAFKVGDIHEYQYAAEFADFKKTKIQLTQQQHDQLIADIETMQRDPDQKTFNVVNSNCSSKVRELLGKIGINIESKGTVAEVFLGQSAGKGFLKVNFPPIKWIKAAGDSILSILRNLLMYILGGGRNKEQKGFCAPRHNPTDRAFPSFFDIFKPKQGLFDHPKKVRQWQQKIDAKREEEKRQIRERTLAKFAELPPVLRQSVVDRVVEEQAKKLQYQLPNMTA